MKKRLFSVSGLVLAGTALATTAFSGIASAAVPAVVIAAVTGTVGVHAPTAACPASITDPLLGAGAVDYQGDFSKVAIPGVFSDNSGAAYAGAVTLGNNLVVACGHTVLGAGNVGGNPVPVVADGILNATAAGSVTNSFPGVGTLSGNVTGGNFVQAGTVALATVGISYSVNGGTAANVKALAIITVLPLPGTPSSCPGVAAGVCETANGPVIGTDAVTLPSL